MKWSPTEFTVSQEEAVQWAAWFVKANSLSDGVAALLIGFMQSGGEWAHREEAKASGVKCPKCHGRGHSNLILLGETKGAPCDNCEGTGYVNG